MAKNKYKLLVTDIDGTLQSETGEISLEDRAALMSIRERGMQVAVSTGRITTACRDLFELLSLEGYHIFCDGALVSDITGKSIIYQQALGDELVQETIDFAHTHNVYLELATGAEYFVEQETEATLVHSKLLNMEPQVVNFAELKVKSDIIKENLVKVCPDEEEGISAFREMFSGRTSISRVNIPRFPGVDFINIVACDVSKGRATERLARHLGITMDEVVALGDGMNDVSIIAIAGLGIAMGSAPEAVKKAADYVTLDAMHNGVAYAIKKFLLD